MSTSSDWGDDPPTGSRMIDKPPKPEPEQKSNEATAEAPTTEVSVPAERSNPQVRLAVNERSDTFVIPDLGGIAIGHQWHIVSDAQLERIRTAAILSGVNVEVKEE